MTEVPVSALRPDLFTASVDAQFPGTKAEEAKMRAGNIAQLMLHKIQAAQV